MPLKLLELEQNRTNKLTYAPREDSDESGHLPSLISLHCALCSGPNTFNSSVWHLRLMLRLIWVIAGLTGHFFCSVFLQFIFNYAILMVQLWAASWQNQQNGMCAQWRLRSAWASAQCDQSSLSAWRKLGPLATHWAHSWSESSLGTQSFCWFYHVAALIIDCIFLKVNRGLRSV